MNLPHITSRINGIKIPMLHGTVGIMHRFENPDNRLIIASVNPNGVVAKEPERMIIAATKEGADLTPRKPKTEPAPSLGL